MSHEGDLQFYIRSDIGIVKQNGKSELARGIFVEPLGGSSSQLGKLHKAITVFTGREDGFIPESDDAKTLAIANHVIHQ